MIGNDGTSLLVSLLVSLLSILSLTGPSCFCSLLILTVSGWPEVSSCLITSTSVVAVDVSWLVAAEVLSCAPFCSLLAAIYSSRFKASSPEIPFSSFVSFFGSEFSSELAVDAPSRSVSEEDNTNSLK